MKRNRRRVSNSATFALCPLRDNRRSMETSTQPRTLRRVGKPSVNKENVVVERRYIGKFVGPDMLQEQFKLEAEQSKLEAERVAAQREQQAAEDAAKAQYDQTILYYVCSDCSIICRKTRQAAILAAIQEGLAKDSPPRKRPASPVKTSIVTPAKKVMPVMSFKSPAPSFSSKGAIYFSAAHPSLTTLVVCPPSPAPSVASIRTVTSVRLPLAPALDSQQFEARLDELCAILNTESREDLRKFLLAGRNDVAEAITLCMRARRS